MNKIAIVCPCFNESHHVKKFLESLEKQTIFMSNNFDISICFVDGVSTDGTYELLLEYCKDKENFSVLINEMRFVSFGLNLAIDFFSKIKPELLIRLDFHSIYPVNYLDYLVSEFYKLQAIDPLVGNVGVRIDTLPSHNSLRSKVVASVLSSSFGVGNSTFRTKTNIIDPIQVDTVPFGCFLFSAFRHVGVFDCDLLRNQDDEFNLRLIKNKYSIYLLPNLSVEYYARDSFKKLSKMMYQYGFFKPLVNKKCRRFASFRQFVPLLFVLALIIFSIVSIVSLIPLLLIVIAYLSFAALFFIESLKRKLIPKDMKALLLCIFGLFITHFSYGVGYFNGLLNLVFRRKKSNLKSSR